MGKIAVFARHGFDKSYAVAMHREAVELTGAAKPRVLLIGYANGNDPLYENAFTRLYQDDLGCEVMVLRVQDKASPSEEELGAVDRAQLIFLVGGANYSAVGYLKRANVAARIVKAYQNGAVIAGEGTGAAFLFETGYAGCLDGVGMETPITLTVQGLEFARGMFCVGCDNEEVRERFTSALLAGRYAGVGLSDGNALFIDGDRYRCAAYEGAEGAYRFDNYEAYVELVNVFTGKPLRISRLYGQEAVMD